MTPEILYYHLLELGIVLSLGERSDELIIDAPKGVVTDELLALIREQKPALLDLVCDFAERDAIEQDNRDADWQIRLNNSRPLPDVIVIPASTPNTIQAITLCLASQRIGAAA
jgi:hypothetical protein